MNGSLAGQGSETKPGADEKTSLNKGPVTNSDFGKGGAVGKQSPLTATCDSRVQAGDNKRGGGKY
jgi:hypothetical protein